MKQILFPPIFFLVLFAVLFVSFSGVLLCDRWILDFVPGIPPGKDFLPHFLPEILFSAFMPAFLSAFFLGLLSIRSEIATAIKALFLLTAVGFAVFFVCFSLVADLRQMHQRKESLSLGLKLVSGAMHPGSDSVAYIDQVKAGSVERIAVIDWTRQGKESVQWHDRGRIDNAGNRIVFNEPGGRLVEESFTDQNPILAPQYRLLLMDGSRKVVKTMAPAEVLFSQGKGRKTDLGQIVGAVTTWTLDNNVFNRFAAMERGDKVAYAIILACFFVFLAGFAAIVRAGSWPLMGAVLALLALSAYMALFPLLENLGEFWLAKLFGVNATGPVTPSILFGVPGLALIGMGFFPPKKKKGMV